MKKSQLCILIIILSFAVTIINSNAENSLMNEDSDLPLKEKVELQTQVLGTIMLKNKFALMRLKMDCPKEIQKLCQKDNIIDCLDKKRKQIQNHQCLKII